MAIKVAINGFGRIGRNVLRAAIEKPEAGIEIVATNDLTDTKTLAHLLKYDSVLGKLHADVKAGDGEITVNGKSIKVFSIKNPAEIDWSSLGAQIVVESTGFFTKAEAAKGHLRGSVKKVIISAPASGEDITIVLGVNEDKYIAAKHNIISNASCTTNCLAPFAKVIHDKWGIEKGSMVTIHAYTNDQKIHDMAHSDLRRARAAALSMIPTSTGAAKAIALVMPELKGKLDGFAIRVPTPNVSVVDLTVTLAKPATAEEINAAIKKAAEGPMKGIMEFVEEPLVSIDFNHSPLSSSVDGLSTKVIGGNMAKVLAWYDNEWGYSNRVVDLALLMIKKGL